MHPLITHYRVSLVKTHSGDGDTSANEQQENEPLRGAVPTEASWVFPTADHRSLPESTFPAFAAYPHALALHLPVFHGPGTSVRLLPIDLSNGKSQKCGNQRMEQIVSRPGASTERVGEYEVPVDPMDELQCDSCQ